MMLRSKISRMRKELDPNLTNAQIYLATAYASQYIPGAPSPENIRNGDEALKEYKVILDQDPNNLSAIDGIGSILYNMAGTPYDPARLQESKNVSSKAYPAGSVSAGTLLLDRRD